MNTVCQWSERGDTKSAASSSARLICSIRRMDANSYWDLREAVVRCKFSDGWFPPYQVAGGMDVSGAGRLWTTTVTSWRGRVKSPQQSLGVPTPLLGLPDARNRIKGGREPPPPPYQQTTTTHELHGSSSRAVPCYYHYHSLWILRYTMRHSSPWIYQLLSLARWRSRPIHAVSIATRIRTCEHSTREEEQAR